jgi:hypothetical protein
MDTSEMVARRAYSALDERDRRAVDAWRSLGNDLIDALLNSDVLSRERPRRVPADDVAEWSRRLLGTDEDLILQRTAEHEAAHAVVARALGLRLLDVSVSADGRSGETRYESAPESANAIIAVAAEVWISEVGGLVFPRGDADGCREDVRVLVRSTGGDAWAMREARRRARLILAESRDEVLALAEQLARTRHVTFGG